MLWFTFALLASFFLAGIAESNRLTNIAGFRLNLWRASFAFIFLLPFLPMMVWPPEGLFYAVSLVDGLVSISAMAVLLNLSS